MKKTIITHTIRLSDVECSILNGFGDGYNQTSLACKKTVEQEKKSEIEKTIMERPRDFTERMDVVIPKKRFEINDYEGL